MRPLTIEVLRTSSNKKGGNVTHSTVLYGIIGYRGKTLNYVITLILITLITP